MSFNLSDSLDTVLSAGNTINLPAGTVIDFAGSSAPDGYLICDGSAVSRDTYSLLFSAIGTTYGVGDGSTTFNIPDCRGRASIGSGQGSGLTNRTVGDDGGAETHVLTKNQLAQHDHSFGAAKGAGGTNSYFGEGSQADTTNTGSNEAHNNMQPYIVFNKIIKT